MSEQLNSEGDYASTELPDMGGPRGDADVRRTFRRLLVLMVAVQWHTISVYDYPTNYFYSFWGAVYSDPLLQ